MTVYSKLSSRISNPLKRRIHFVQRRFRDGWGFKPVPQDSPWLERWGVRDPDPWIHWFCDYGVWTPIWSFFIYNWLVISDDQLIANFNYWNSGPIRLTP